MAVSQRGQKISVNKTTRIRKQKMQELLIIIHDKEETKPRDQGKNWKPSGQRSA